MGEHSDASDSALSSEEVNENSNRPKIPNWIKTAVALTVSLFFLVYYFRDIDWSEVSIAIANANLTLAIFSLLISQIIFWIFDVYQRDRHFTWFHGPFPWKDYFWVRGALYLIMMFNTSIAMAGLAVYLKKRTHVSWTRFFAIAWFRLVLHISGWTLVLAAITAGFIFTGTTDKLSFSMYPYGYLWIAFLVSGILSFIDIWLLYFHNIKIGLWQFLIKDAKHEFWRPFAIATRMQWVLTMVWGVVPVAIICVGFWFYAYAFGVEIPIFYFGITILLVLTIADSPLSFAGFGTTTLAWVLFYEDYATEAVMASLTLTLPLARMFVRAFVGLICLKPAIVDIQEMFEVKKQNETPKWPRFPVGKIADDAEDAEDNVN
ncbi:MAG: hypothetical protein JKY67_10755 [Pseudomonadales bacterium]|nr:hypothetical protein [Pseudomonadales bacterium]